jgi:hypothetical protein
MARAWAIGPWTLLIVAAPFRALGIHQGEPRTPGAVSAGVFTTKIPLK